MELKLKHGHIALVDEEDLGRISAHRWAVSSKRGLLYVETRIKGKTVGLHRFVMGQPKGMTVDHINRNGLDNRKCNLRICTTWQNNSNQGLHKNSTTGLKGVWKKKNQKGYEVKIRNNGKRYYIGFFMDPIVAAKAYDEAAKKYHGEFAVTNF